jgi:hypothetical protein
LTGVERNMTDAKDIGDITKPIAGAIVFVAASYFYIQTQNWWFLLAACLGILAVL